MCYTFCQLDVCRALPLQPYNLPAAVRRFLDGRVWPLEDELEVRLMIDLIRHVTGAPQPPFLPLPRRCTIQASSNSRCACE